MYPISVGRETPLQDTSDHWPLSQSPSLRRVRSTLASPFSLSPKAYHFPRSLLLSQRARPHPLSPPSNPYDDPEVRQREALAAATAAFESAHGTQAGNRDTGRNNSVIFMPGPTPPEARLGSNSSRGKRYDGSVRSLTETVTPLEEKILYYRRRERLGCQSPWISRGTNSANSNQGRFTERINSSRGSMYHQAGLHSS